MAQKRATIASHALDDAHIDLTPVRDRRAPLEAINSLPDAHEALRDFVSAATSNISQFPSVMKASAKDRLVSYSVRLRLSQVERLEQLKAERGIVPSELIRDFIDRCLPQV